MSLVTNIRKTINYCSRNGLRETYFAARERMQEGIRNKVGASYEYEAPTLDALNQQRDFWKTVETVGTAVPLISFLVPMYHPNLAFMREMLESMLAQTWENYEVILADASTDDAPEKLVEELGSGKIYYHKLDRNEGISGNTNAAAKFARGDYVALLDYDDLLTPDCVYEITHRILYGCGTVSETDEETRAFQAQNAPEILYSDEDKCDAKAEHFFEPNRKPDFNPDYLLSNNYICHLMVMKRELFLALMLRSEYDGAQDYDLILRAPWSCVHHIGKVLYHWRTHGGSTAGNPASKDYAYEAGMRALEDYLQRRRINATVQHAKHRGFYNIVYTPDIFTARREVGVVGGKILDKKNRIVGGMMDEKGQVVFAGLHKMESGSMHRADTRQNAYAVDVRCMEIRDELRPLYQSVFNAAYETHVMHIGDEALKLKSIEFCRLAAEQGYLIVWDPSIIKVI